jgi:hypothetical protein
LGNCFARRIRNEKFLASNANAFPSMIRIDFRGMRLQPRRIPIELFALRSRFGQFDGIGYFFQDNVG